MCAVFICAAGAYAYNPPAGGQMINQLQSPTTLTGGNSAAGGALMTGQSVTSAANPALTAGEQRVVIDVAYTGFAGLGSESGYGNGFNLGTVIPTKWGVASGNIQGLFLPFDAMPLKNTVIVRGGFSKDITETFYVGAGISAAFGMDWGLNLELGVGQNLGKVGFMRDFRWGAALTGIGKPYSPSSVNGIFGGKTDGYPSMFTLQAGAAATFVSAGIFKLGLSADVSLPTFQNLVFDAGLEARFADIVSLRSGWTVNLREIMEGRTALSPSLGLSVLFTISAKDDSFLGKQGWQKSELVPSIAARTLYDGITAFSAGTTVYFGLKDTAAPVITIWGDDE